MTAFQPGLDRTMAFRVIGTPIGIASLVGEAGMCLWLLIKGPPVFRAGVAW